MADGEGSPVKPMRRTQKQRREATRERILEAAHQALIERGYSGASTWAVCDTGGFSKGTLLHHFRKKSHLFQAVIAERSRESLRSLDDAMNASQPGSHVEVFLDWLWSTLDGDFFVIGLEILTAARADAELRETVRLGADALTKLLDQFIDTAIQETAISKRALLRTALQTSVHLVRGIGLDLAVGGNRQLHQERFLAWRKTVLALA